MTGSKQLANILKSIPKSIHTRSKSVTQNTLTGSAQNNENNEELVVIVKGIIKEEFKEHERKINEEFKEHEKKINEMLKSQLENTNKRLEKISKEVLEITKSLEFTQGQLNDEIAIVKNDISQIKADIREIEDDLLDLYDVSNKLVEMEDGSWRNNLCFGGLVENPKETWEECERKVQEVISNHLEIEHDVEIERCHHMEKRKGNRPRTIVCNFLRFKDMQKILQNAKKLKDAGIYVYEDFSNETMEVRKSLWEKVLEYRRQGKYASLNYRKIVVRDNS